MTDRSLMTRLLLGVLPIVISLAITAMLILLVNANPIEVFQSVMEGAFRNSESLAGVVNFWIPLALVSLGLVICFTAGLWNIGVEGQMMIGAVFASAVAQSVILPSPLLIGLELIAAVIGGMLWGLLVGILKTRLGVHEIFGGVALNALANVISIYLIAGPWAPPQGGNSQATAPFAVDALLPPLSAEFPVSLLALIIVIVVSAGTYFALRGTRWGLQLKATGKNSRSALLLGVPTEQVSLSALAVCGAMAGLAGAYRVLFTYGSMRALASGGIGFLGLLVVLLVSARALWTPLVAFVFAIILAGSTRLKIALQLDPSLAGVLQSTLVLVVLMFNGLRERLSARAEVKKAG